MVQYDWYEYGWSLDMKNQAWAEDTENEVNFIIKALKLTGTERILDLACGWGRHSLAFARRGGLPHDLAERPGARFRTEWMFQSETMRAADRQGGQFPAGAGILPV